MPNTLVHLCIQTPASRLLLRGSDFKWIAIGCIIPDIPWILQRIITFVPSEIDLINVRIYAVIQASFFFCLIFSLALSLLTPRPGRIFLLLTLNVFMHLLLDALQTKWANGVHFLAPFSWKMTDFTSIWPEHALVYILSALGLGVLIYSGVEGREKTVRFTKKKIQWFIAVLLMSAYFFLPFFMFRGPEKENNHYVATLSRVEQRAGKVIELDRRKFRSSDKTIEVFSGERLRLHGNLPDSDTLLSIRGTFIDKENIQVAAYHSHNPFRSLASQVALLGIFFIWLLAILRKNITFTDNYQQ